MEPDEFFEAAECFFNFIYPNFCEKYEKYEELKIENDFWSIVEDFFNTIHPPPSFLLEE